MKCAIGVLSAALCLLPRVSAAQVPHTFEAFSSIGGAKYDASKIHELNLGGGLVLHPFSKNPSLIRGLGFEFEANWTAGESVYSPARKTATGAVVYGFLFKRTEPYVLLGMGGSTLGCYGFNEGCDPGIRVGVGGIDVRLFANEHVSLRPEFRVFEPMGNNVYIEGPGGVGYHLYRVSIGIAYQWH